MDLTLVHNLMEGGYHWESVAAKLRATMRATPVNAQYAFCLVASPLAVQPIRRAWS